MSKITKSAQNQECQVRIDPQFCDGPETTVLAHLNGAGMGKKAPDSQGAYACARCHRIIDGHEKHPLYGPGDIEFFHIQGVLRTQRILLEKGLLKEA